VTMTPAPTKPRLDRRRARTRRALLDAARRILVERGTTDVSIQEITDEADVGFGSFYNHFETKTELFEAAVAEVLDEYGAALDRACEGIEDSAEIYAVGLRMTARLGQLQPAAARVLLQVGLEYISSPEGLSPRALRDIERGIEDGRFKIANPLVGLAATAGCVLAFLQLSLENPAALGDEDADDLAEMLLKMLGMSTAAARSVAHRPLPPVSFETAR
jgi:AcrR family transcriptional regulator